MRRALIAVVTLLSLSPLQAQDETHPFTPERIERIHKFVQERGTAEDKFELGGFYFSGDGVPQDYTEALSWLRLAALDDHLEAQFIVGGMYHQGIGVQQDWVKGALWWRLSAEKGHVESQYYLGRAYSDGEGVARNYPAAVRQYRRASELGHAKSQYQLGLSYGVGRGVIQDPIQAHKWLNIAAARMSGDEFKEAMESRDLLAEEMSVG